MTDSTILTITNDERFLKALREQIHDQSGGGRMIVAGTIDEACSLLPMSKPCLIVLHWGRQGGQYEELNRLLWATSVLARQVPVVVIADRYRVDQATRLYRMGVAEYISRSHHGEQSARVLDSYLHKAPASSSPPRPTGSMEAPRPASNSWLAPAQSRSAHVV